MTHILIVDDEPDIRELMRLALEGAGFQVTEAEDASGAERVIVAESPDLVLLDWMLPGSSGLDLARRLRENRTTRSIPIVMVSARGAEEDRVRGLDTGADDYIAKPFSPREMISRVKAVLRRASQGSDRETVEIAGLCLDTAGHRISANGRPLQLAPTEYRLLHFFMTHPDRAFSRSQLLDQVWGQQVYVEERTVDVHIRRLRKTLEATGHHRLLQTVRGMGYRFSERT